MAELPLCRKVAHHLAVIRRNLSRREPDWPQIFEPVGLKIVYYVQQFLL